MQFAIIGPIARTDGDLATLLRELVSEAQEAEAVGFDAFFLTEFHQARHNTFSSPLHLLTAIAAQTSRIKLGTLVLNLPIYHPIHLAEDIATLDVVSNGRVILGVGMGHRPEDFYPFDVPFQERAARFEEAIALLRSAWREESIQFAGRHFNYDQLRVVPKPIQLGGPPIWIGAYVEVGARRAARLGDAWVADPSQNLGRAGYLSRVYRNVAKTAGRKPFTVLFREGWVAKSDTVAFQNYGEHALRVHRLYWHVGLYREDSDPWLAEIVSSDDFSLERVAPGRFLIGSPITLIEQIRHLRECTGADMIAIRMHHPTGPAHLAVKEAIHLFAKEVMPAFK